ncbi:DUF6455 family protein [Jannaschia seohaensis]|uniref:DUF6455 domain-containing protein n=1 Tax=Jannaschia seohaensis TaxID=475081 RepID=A0A2Y9A2U8_9RHOB|nr:DUF6455 family protein [Jannaschia seohaensis]PWJ22486.1 hypothetical protein BCF38_101900 [Jannaschia seohaensis]SSA38764.1 hypothetical protein SAMN05421539_101900 [Jannaschia seohaensis]
MSRPHPMGDTRTHLMLFRTMAAQTGADTLRAFEEGTLDADGWVDAVERCRDCRWVEGCQRFLARPAEGRKAVPQDCANADLLREIVLPG